MKQKITEKYLNKLEKEISLISVVNNQKLKPYIEIFHYYPENVALQALGNVAGFFQINDDTQDSEYIVNFLASIIKKEYYSNFRRGVSESLDASLKKINLALAELAREGNINWLGKLDAAICVIEKNNLHFSVCGKAHIILIRNGAASNISEGTADTDEEPNPLKTFEDVSSGRLEDGDKIIASSESIFEVFSISEIKKSCLNFNREKFCQFIRTALVNKLEFSGTIIIDVFKIKELLPERKSQEGKDEESSYLNAFSEKTFKEKTKKKILPEAKKEDEREEYTDKKTGHIYVQGEYQLNQRDGVIFFANLKDKIGDAFFSAKEGISGFSSFLGRKIKKISFSKVKNEKNKIQKIEEFPEVREERPAALEQTAYTSLLIKSKVNLKKISVLIQAGRIKNPLERIRKYFTKKEAESGAFKKSGFTIPEKSPEGVSLEEKINSRTLGEKIMPSFSRIKYSFENLNQKQKIYAVAIVAAILILPAVFLKIDPREETPANPEPAAETKPDPRTVFAGEKNMNFIETVESIASVSGTKHLITAGKDIFAITEDRIFRFGESGKKDFAPSGDFGKFQKFSYMDDLNLILILTDQKKILSFSPVSSQYKENSISFPENSDIQGIATYLTYIYALDAKNSQIYRYPRAEGGFGDKANWLKETIDLSQAKGIAIDENVYISNSEEVLKLFKGKKQEFNLEKTSVPAKISKALTSINIKSIYILDAENGRIVKFSKDGILERQYFHEKLKSALDFSVSEGESRIYFADSEGNIISFGT